MVSILDIVRASRLLILQMLCSIYILSWPLLFDTMIACLRTDFPRPITNKFLDMERQQIFSNRRQVHTPRFHLGLHRRMQTLRATILEALLRWSITAAHRQLTEHPPRYNLHTCNTKHRRNRSSSHVAIYLRSLHSYLLNHMYNSNTTSLDRLRIWLVRQVSHTHSQILRHHHFHVGPQVNITLNKPLNLNNSLPLSLRRGIPQIQRRLTTSQTRPKLSRLQARRSQPRKQLNRHLHQRYTSNSLNRLRSNHSPQDNHNQHPNKHKRTTHNNLGRKINK
jgi:hypothetical protein